MLPERMALEMQKATKSMGEQIEMQRTQMMNELIQKATQVDNKVVNYKYPLYYPDYLHYNSLGFLENQRMLELVVL